MDYLEILHAKKEKRVDVSAMLDRDLSEKDAPPMISSGSGNLDKVLGGGFRSGTVYVVHGGFRAGKTQLCHQACVQVHAKFSKGPPKGEHQVFTYYIDTENTFRPERIRQIAMERGVEHSQVLKNILVSKVMSNQALLLKLKEIEEGSTDGDPRLLVIDSINNHYRKALGDGFSSYFTLKKRFRSILDRISDLTRRMKLITLLTSQVSPSFGEYDTLITELPVGNKFLDHYFHEFLYLSHKEEDKRFAHLVNSHARPERRLMFKITAKGIQDYTFP